MVLMVVMTLVSVLAGCVRSQIVPSTAVDGTTCTFTYISASASSVNLAGDFNNWDSASLPMKKIDGKTWIMRIQLEKGVYQYQFIVDHETPVPPPHAAAYAADGFGGKNGIVIVPGGLPGVQKRVTD
jgi:1,4-alpha-glucan branching enzyme